MGRDLVHRIQTGDCSSATYRNILLSLICMIVEISDSKKASKRYCVRLDDGRTFDFGLKNGSTYIDHHDVKKRENYWKRHLANKTEHRLITNLIPSPALFSAMLLWGDSTSLNKNIRDLNHLLSRPSK